MKEITEWNLKLASRIINTTRFNGFTSAITKGERGHGKTMYNLKVMAKVYHEVENITEKESWYRALEHMIFTPDQLLNIVENNLKNEVITPCICIDDAAVHFSSYLFFVNLYEASLLNATFDIIRTVTNSLLLNCPSKRRLLSGLRHYDDYEITIYKDRDFQRKAVAIKWYSLPDGHRKYRKEFEDRFSCWVPDEYYDAYMIRRKECFTDVSNDLKILREKLRDKKLHKLQEVIAEKEDVNNDE